MREGALALRPASLSSVCRNTRPVRPVLPTHAAVIVLAACAALVASPEDAPPEVAPPDAPGAPEEPPPSPPSGFWPAFRDDPTFDGRLDLFYRARYRGRFYDFDGFDFPIDDPAAIGPFDLLHAAQLEARHEDDQDHDLDQYFSLSLRDVEPPWEAARSVIQSAGADVSLRHFVDLEGSPAGEESLGPFDVFSGSEELQLLELNTTLETFQRHLVLTLGRQRAREAEWVHFDGARGRFRGLRLLGRPVELSAFGGTRVKLYPRTVASRDGIWGGRITLWPWEDGRIELSDVFYLDNSFEARFRQVLPSWGWLGLTYRQINEDPERVRLDLSWEWPSQDLTAYLTSIHKLGRDADDFDFDFTRSRREGEGAVFLNLGDLAPYDEVSFEARKGFLEHYGAIAGATIHRLRERDLKDVYNHDWYEVWAGLDVLHAPWKGLTGRATLRYLRTDLPRRLLRLDPELVITNDATDFLPQDITGDGEPDFLGLELLLEQDFSRYVVTGGVLELKTYDYRSNYVILDNLTLASVAGYIRWRPTRRTEWSLRYTFTRDFRFINPDLDALHTVELQFVYRL